MAQQTELIFAVQNPGSGKYDLFTPVSAANPLPVTGGGGGGGGGAVTVADGADATQGANADAAAAVGGAGTLSAKARLMTSQLDTLGTQTAGIGVASDAAAAVGGTGTASAKLRRITTQLDSIQTLLTAQNRATEYEAVAASQTNQVMGATGAAGDFLSGILATPATTSPGAISIKDGSNTAIVVFTGGATSVSSLVPFFIPLNLISLSGAWQITTGANVSALGIGDFT